MISLWLPQREGNHRKGIHMAKKSAAKTKPAVKVADLKTKKVPKGGGGHKGGSISAQWGHAQWGHS